MYRILAWCIILSPTDNTLIHNPSIQNELRKIAHENDWIEDNYATIDDESLVRCCREGYRLSKEIPSISDKYLWIENDKYYLGARQFNEEFQRYCKEQIKINRRGWEEALGESKELNRIYYLIQHITNNDDVYDTKYNGFSKTFKKRLCLKELRKRLGEENYYKGYVPPCVPIWRFTEF